LNVLHISSGRGPTGAAAAAMNDVLALLAAGHKAWLAVRGNSALAQACGTTGVPFLDGLAAGQGALKILHLPRDVRWLRSVVREYAIDAVHTHRSDDQILATAALGRNLTAKLVRSWHRDPAAVPRPLLARLAAHVDGCVCVAREDAATLRTAGAPQSVFLHAAVDTTLFRPLGQGPPPAPSHEGRGETCVRIAHVGRWKRDRQGRDRGQRQALDVFAQLPGALPWKGFLVGRGELADVLRRETYSARGLAEERVQLLEFAEQSPPRFAELLATFHLGLVFEPGSDGTSRPGRELLACGVPLLVTDRRGLRELAEDPACAVRLLPDDPQGWARAIAGLLSTPQRLAEMALAARACAEREHALPVRGRALAQFYAAL